MKYSETHEWIDQDGTVGISTHAAKELGDIVYVELPKVGHKIKAKEIAAVLESTKAAADVYSPVSGTVLEVNERLKTDSSLVNTSAEKNGWLFKINIDHKEELNTLLDEQTYLKMVQ